jgi:hypothetical protein
MYVFKDIEAQLSSSCGHTDSGVCGVTAFQQCIFLEQVIIRANEVFHIAKESTMCATHWSTQSRLL